MRKNEGKRVFQGRVLSCNMKMGFYSREEKKERKNKKGP
jgi:hypothetical protein